MAQLPAAAAAPGVDLPGGGHDGRVPPPAGGLSYRFVRQSRDRHRQRSVVAFADPQLTELRESQRTRTSAHRGQGDTTSLHVSASFTHGSTNFGKDRRQVKHRRHQASQSTTASSTRFVCSPPQAPQIHVMHAGRSMRVVSTLLVTYVWVPAATGTKVEWPRAHFVPAP